MVNNKVMKSSVALNDITLPGAQKEDETSPADKHFGVRWSKLELEDQACLVEL